jgi:hypothetical protein
MKYIQLGKWQSKESSNQAEVVKVDNTHVWYTQAASRGHIPCLRSVWLASMDFVA